MKYSLDLRLIAKDRLTFEGIQIYVPSKTDNRVWDVEYNNNIVIDEFTGLPVLTAQVRFHNDVDRTDVENAISSLQTIFNGLEVGSKIQLHICRHDEKPPRCEVETIYEVVP